MSIIRFGDRQRYTVVANEAIEDARLSFRARGILLWLLSKPDGWHIQSGAITASGTEGRDAVRAALAELESLGYLVRSKDQDELGRWRTVCTLYERPTPGNPASDTRPSVDPALSNKTLKVKTEEQERALPDGFEAFWNTYPRKTAKQNALKAFGRLSVTDRTLALVALPKHIAWWERRGDMSFVPHAATWLNARRWEDVLPGEPAAGGAGWREPDEVWYDGANVAHRYPEVEYK